MSDDVKKYSVDLLKGILAGIYLRDLYVDVIEFKKSSLPIVKWLIETNFSEIKGDEATIILKDSRKIIDDVFKNATKKGIKINVKINDEENDKDTNGEKAK